MADYTRRPAPAGNERQKMVDEAVRRRKAKEKGRAKAASDKAGYDNLERQKSVRDARKYSSTHNMGIERRTLVGDPTSGANQRGSNAYHGRPPSRISPLPASTARIAHPPSQPKSPFSRKPAYSAPPPPRPKPKHPDMAEKPAPAAPRAKPPSPARTTTAGGAPRMPAAPQKTPRPYRAIDRVKDDDRAFNEMRKRRRRGEEV